MREDYSKKSSNAIEINEAQIQDHLGELVRGTIKETINSMIDAEADVLCNASRYERMKARKDTRAGYYKRTQYPRIDKGKLKVLRLRQQKFETAIIERYRRRELSIEEAMIEMYIAGVYVRHVEDNIQVLLERRSVRE